MIITTRLAALLISASLAVTPQTGAFATRSAAPIRGEIAAPPHAAAHNDNMEKTYLGKYYITGYDACVACCGKSDGITANGSVAEVGRTCAAGTALPFGTTLYIEGIGERVVEDRGVKNGCVDIFCANHAECYALTGWYDVYIVEGGDG